MRLRTLQQRVRQAAEGVGIGRLADQLCFCIGIAPGFVRHAAQCHTHVADAAVFVQIQRGRYRDQRERIRKALADLEVGAVRNEALRIGQIDMHDQFVRRQGAIQFRAIARQAVELRERNVALSPGALHMHHGIQRSQGHAHIRWMRGDAVRAGAENGVVFGQPANGRTAGARVAFVARGGMVVEIHAARALQQVAAIAGHVANLRRSAGQNRRAQQGVTRFDLRVICGVGIARQRTQAQTAIGLGADAVQRQPIDVDQAAGAHQLQFHQVGEIGAAGDEAHRCLGGHRLRVAAAHCNGAKCGIDGVRACVGERNHAGTVPGVHGVAALSLLSLGMPSTSITASVICG